jgi:hypothetical protein
MRYAAVLPAACLGLLVTACGVDTTRLVGTHIKPLANHVPGPGDDIHTFCTAYDPDPALHVHTIAEEVAAHKPFILLFGTPAHCTQCQTQIDTVRGYRERYKGAFDVIHIDQYKNGQVYTQLGVRGDPWTFLVNADGVIMATLPGVTAYDDLGGEIDKMLQSAAPAQPVPARQAPAAAEPAKTARVTPAPAGPARGPAS